MINFFAPLKKDMYKAFHKHAYRVGTTHVYSNYTNRFGKHSNIPGNAKVMFLGLQYFILEELIKNWNDTFFKIDADTAVKKYKRVIEAALGKKVDAEHIRELHALGYLPLEIKSLEEGELVPYAVPSLTITNTVSGFGWLVNMIETVLSAEIWGICTSATTAFAYRQRFEAEPSLDKFMIPFMGHDFSYRGMFGTAAAAMSGFGHLASFAGSDTIPAALFAEEYYGADFDTELVFASVDATEHSVMCSYGQGSELDSLIHLITNVTPCGIISIVSDTWDFWKLVTEYLPSVKDIIMAREGTVVIRPDSGDPVKILTGYKVFEKYSFDTMYDALEHASMYPQDTYNCEAYKLADGTYLCLDTHTILQEHEVKGLIECLWDTFGGTIENGLRKLDSHIGAIYGDSITLKRQDEIIERLKGKGFVPSVVLGIGSFTYQYVTRDTHGSAVKATDIQLGTDNHFAIAKDPKTDSSKKSAKGLLMVVRDCLGELTLVSDVTPEMEASDENLLRPVFRDGVLLRRTTLKEIREKVNTNFTA